MTTAAVIIRLVIAHSFYSEPFGTSFYGAIQLRLGYQISSINVGDLMIPAASSVILLLDGDSRSMGK
jgi:hypothetical protein